MRTGRDGSDRGQAGAGDVLNRLFGGLLFLFGAFSALTALWALSEHGAWEDQKRTARQAGPPAPAAIESFHAPRDVGATGEVTLRAFVSDGEAILDPTPSARWILPLRAVAGERAPPSGWLVHPHRRWSPGAVTRWTIERRPGGAIVEIPARRIDPRYHYGALTHVRGRDDLDDNPLVFEPFLDGRDAALAPNAGWRPTLFLAAALVIAGAGAWLFRRA